MGFQATGFQATADLGKLSEVSSLLSNSHPARPGSNGFKPLCTFPRAVVRAWPGVVPVRRIEAPCRDHHVSGLGLRRTQVQLTKKLSLLSPFALATALAVAAPMAATAMPASQPLDVAVAATSTQADYLYQSHHYHYHYNGHYYNHRAYKQNHWSCY
jgi:hypothetical protein